MKGLIIINAYPNGEKFFKQAERIAQELRLLGVGTDVLKNGEVFAVLQGDGKINASLSQKYDFAIYLDKDKYLGQMLENAGLRLFNRAKAIEICDDKMLTYLALKDCGVTLAKSIPAPLCYTKGAKVNENFLNNVAKELGFPMVVKKSYGSFGEGVHLIHGMPELIKIGQEFISQPHFYQAFISESFGRDIRVIVIGGKAIAAMERVAKDGEFRSNIELGGEGKNIQLQDHYRVAAEKVAMTLDLDYCGVDLLETSKGAIVCEVNSNAFFEGLERTTGVNVAAAYARYVYESMQK